MHEIKVAVLGPSGVGKSTTTIQFFQNFFLEESDSTLEDTFRKRVILNGEECMLNVTDTAGSSKFTAYRETMFKNHQGFVLMYSVISRRSFEAVESYRDAVLQAKEGERIPMILVGNMTDLKDIREVGTTEGEELAKIWGIPFLESSATSLQNSTEVFMEISSRIRIGEITDKIDNLRDSAAKLQWYKFGKKGKLAKSIKTLMAEQMQKETQFKLMTLNNELAKATWSSDSNGSSFGISESSFHSEITRLWSDHDTSDITIMVESIPFYCHSPLLVIRCPVLYKLTPPPSGVLGSSFSLPAKYCTSSVVFSVILMYVYTGEIPTNLHVELGQHIRNAASAFELHSLAKKMQNWPYIPFEPEEISWDLLPLFASEEAANIVVKSREGPNKHGAIPPPRTFMAHRCVMQTRMIYYSRLFGNLAEIEIEKAHPEAVKAVFQYAYSDRLTTHLNPGQLTDVVHLSNRFGMNRLSQMAEKSIHEKLSVEGISPTETTEILLAFWGSQGVSSCSQQLRERCESSAISSKGVFEKLKENERFSMVLNGEQRETLQLRHEELMERLSERAALEKQIETIKSKLRQV
eukprot:TRINITY_DN1585_c0_g1_i1.p1 TRINITY_DN1585_c0_g1~~TRINITY_DN1585_c0_g1_i1.p1  ORF type:complete len:578 (-),score=181.70 TRINITY_DN1585_c0_g1_i1:44-1777(-)